MPKGCRRQSKNGSILIIRKNPWVLYFLVSLLIISAEFHQRPGSDDYPGDRLYSLWYSVGEKGAEGTQAGACAGWGGIEELHTPQANRLDAAKNNQIPEGGRGEEYGRFLRFDWMWGR